jgi:signal transduction histidine kinase
VTVSATDAPQGSALESAELRLLFHRLNNELGIILAHAELLEAKALDEPNRGRAHYVVSSALNAMSTVREIRDLGRTERAPGTSPAS